MHGQTWQSQQWGRALGEPAPQVGKYFRLKERNSTFTTEMRAGTVTFLTVRRAWTAQSWLVLPDIKMGCWMLVLVCIADGIHPDSQRPHLVRHRRPLRAQQLHGEACSCGGVLLHDACNLFHQHVAALVCRAPTRANPAACRQMWTESQTRAMPPAW